jgi:hypothetical protein
VLPPPTATQSVLVGQRDAEQAGVDTGSRNVPQLPGAAEAGAANRKKPIRGLEGRCRGEQIQAAEGGAEAVVALGLREAGLVQELG